MMCLAQAADIFATGIVAGAFHIGTVAVHPAAGRLDSLWHCSAAKDLIRRLQRALPPFMLLPVLATIGTMALCPALVSWPLDALGCILSLATIEITVTVSAPLNQRFAAWLPDALVSTANQSRAYW